ncbi:MAG: hypothetical protein IKE01_06490 [Clostridia bacterium]|nr:hypothetical protein [Clostridia bacterium]
MDIAIEDLLKCMLNFYQNVDKQLKAKQDEEKLLNDQQQDILHYIEATTLNASGYAKVGKRLKQLRLERRVVKNEIEKLTLIQGLTQKHNNRMIQGDIIQLLKGLQTIEKRQAEPKYVCRTNILEKLEEKQNDSRNTNEVTIT